MKRILVQGLLVAAILVGSYSSLQAVSVNVGGLAIADNGPKDLNPAVDIIQFDAYAPAPNNFPTTYSSLMGTVSLGSGGALVGLPVGANVVKLTDLWVARGAGDVGGLITISFQHTFPGPDTAAIAGDAIDGEWASSAPPAILLGHTISFQGYVNGTPISPPGVPFSNTSVGAVGAATQPFSGAHGPMAVPPPAGPPWTLRGDVTFSLVGTSNQLDLPASAEVGIAAMQIPTFTEWGFIIFGGLLLGSVIFYIWRRRRLVVT